MQDNKDKIFLITVKDGRACEAKNDETVLSALARSGIALSAPCGGRGICGKCHIILREGTIRLIDESRTQIKPGDTFSACRGIPLSDITVELEDENIVLDSRKNKNQKGVKILHAGAGIDIGTTTVQLELICLDTGNTLETISLFNAQRSFGADVMSRIKAAKNGKTKELFTAINRQIEGMLQHCINSWALSGIEQCTISGNTTMLHLFCGIDPSSMGEVPFTPVFLEDRHYSGKELSLSADNITVLPGISAFVGADIVSGLAYIDILNQKEDSLFVDIGTNGEMALWKKDKKKLLSCSTAAGPCFEGAEITCGMGALPGAINHILLKEKINANGPLSYTTLENIPPKGMCGSGLIDAIAAMLQLKAIDETGALSDEYAEEGFPLAEGIRLCQKDIRQFQLAKSAILSGITILCKKAGIENLSSLGTVYIAGGLGFFINVQSAVTAGLLPKEFAGSSAGIKINGNTGDFRTAVCGNTSLNGAVKSLREPAFISRCREIIALSNTMELARENDFTEVFAENMYFPS